MNSYLIPANSKKGQLIFNLFREIDLAVIGIGIAITLILAVAIQNDHIIWTIVKLMPIGISVLLVVPVAYYHNVLVFIQEMIKYYTSQNVYKWKGWCATHVTNDIKQK